MLDLVFRNQTNSKTFSRAFFARVLTVAVKTLNVQGIVNLSINLVGPAKMKALNKKYRGKNIPTDVLSFPLADKAIKHYNYGETDLGDIFICPAVCKQRAKSLGKSLEDYVTWASVHGFLHLCGFDHEKSPKAAKKMSALEKKILKKV